MFDIYDKLVDAVRAAIFLGKGQVDLAVEPNRLHQVNRCFTILNNLRLLSSDPLFLSDDNRFSVQTACTALSDMKQKYCDEINNALLRWDQRLADWFAVEVQRFDKLILHYRKQF